MHTQITHFHDEPKVEKILTGNKLLIAILLSFAVMLIAIILGLQLAFASGSFWLGFLPLALGWLLLYPAFKKLES